MEDNVATFASLLRVVIDNRGRTCPTAPNGKRLIATNCVWNDHLFPSYENVRFVDDNTFKTWFRGHPEPGDMIFVTKGTPGRVCLAPEPVDFCIAQDMVALRADESKVYPRYLFALLRSTAVQERIEQLHVGTLIPHFKKGDFDKLLLHLPDKKTQKFVGDIYFSLSAKIELNRQMNETLEAMARTLFKSWFVDFDPVRAKVEGRTSSYAPEADSLFPSTLEPDESPTGWRCGTLIDLCELKRGYDLPTSQRSPGPYPIVSSSGISGVHSAPMAEGPGVVTGRYGTIGEVYFINEAYWPLNTALYVRDFKGNCPRFVYYALRHVDFLQYSDKAAVPGINRNHLHQAPMVIAPQSLQEAFEKLLTPIWAKQEANQAECATLTALRDTLLPKLISGELRVKAAEKIVEAVA